MEIQIGLALAAQMVALPPHFYYQLQAVSAAMEHPTY
jgi:hypothetical protein